MRNRIKELRMMKASEIQAHPENWRQHPPKQKKALRAVLDEIGYANAVIAYESAEGLRLIDGHLRRDVAGDEEIPVLVTDLSEDEARAALATLDPLAMMADSQMDLLTALAKGLKEFESVNEVLTALVGEVIDPLYEGEPPEAQIDRAEELNERWQVQRGDVWVIPSAHGGEHRLLCGDSTSADDVARIGLSKTVLFDPPWQIADSVNVEYDELIAFTDGGRFGDVIDKFGTPAWVFTWDCVTSWYTPNRPLRRAKYAVWYGDVSNYQFDGAHYGEPGVAKKVKNTRGVYDYSPDERGKHLSDVFSHAITSLHSDGEHSHEKPLDWVRMIMGNCFAGDIVYDPFAGSGTTMVACEQLGKICHAIELDSKYCAVILERMSAMGLNPRRDGLA